VGVWWSATYGVVAREGGSATQVATGCNGGGQWLLQLSAHAESLSLAVLKVGDVFFAPVVAAMGA
jgi:hypothetical protein